MEANITQLLKTTDKEKNIKYIQRKTHFRQMNKNKL